MLESSVKTQFGPLLSKLSVSAETFLNTFSQFVWFQMNGSNLRSERGYFLSLKPVIKGPTSSTFLMIVGECAQALATANLASKFQVNLWIWMLLSTSLLMWLPCHWVWNRQLEDTEASFDTAKFRHSIGHPLQFRLKFGSWPPLNEGCQGQLHLFFMSMSS